MLRIALLLLTLAAPAAAQTEPQAWEMRVAGIPIGVATLALTGGYRIDATARTIGAADLVRPYAYAARTTGTARGGRLSPAAYAQTERVRGEESRLALTLGPAPTVRAKDDPTLPSATLRGALDPLTALHLVLRDRPTAGACDLSVRFTDGVRMGTVALAPTSDPMRCAGTWRRVAGPPPADARERRRAAAFRLDLAPTPGGVRVAELSADAPIGRFRLIRR